jgi:protein-S-isoprenylcysteine O-methyltransferase Ste14
VFAGTLGYTALFGLFLLAPAPWPIPWRAWVLLATLFVVRFALDLTVHRRAPAILRARTGSPIQPGQPFVDRVLLLAFMLTFALLVSVASVDGLRLHVLGSIPDFLAPLGLLLFVIGWCISGFALLSNAFALTAVTPQLGQVVATTGPYAHVRHPIYLGGLLVMLGESVWLTSWLALLAAAIPLGILIVRIRLEERFLRDNVAGYPEYASRVPCRLVPHVW